MAVMTTRTFPSAEAGTRVPVPGGEGGGGAAATFDVRVQVLAVDGGKIFHINRPSALG